MGPRKVFKWVLIGTSLSYLFFHPFVMVMGHLMREADLYHGQPALEIIVAEILMAFSLKMLPWALGFAIFGALTGLSYGMFKRAQDALKNEKAFSDSLFDSTQSGMVLLSDNKEIIRINRAALRELGMDKEDILGRICHSFLCPSKVGNCPVIDLGQEVDSSQRMVLDKDGKEIPVIKTVGKVEKDGKTYILESFVNIQDLKKTEDALRQSEEKYRELSITDDLTRLFNSRHFHAQLKSEVRRASRYSHPLSLLLMDVDNFKRYNDTYGHPEGDVVLSGLGKVIRRALRDTDSGYRYGGEEFTVILPETRGEEALVVAERIRRGFEMEPSTPRSDKAVPVTVSIGVSQYRTDEETEAFIKRADEAMYRAKEQGKNQIVIERR